MRRSFKRELVLYEPPSQALAAATARRADSRSSDPGAESMQLNRFTIKSQEALAAAQRLAGARANPEVVPSTCCSRCSSRRAASWCPCCGAPGADPEPRAPAAPTRRSTALPTVTGEAVAHAPALGRELTGC